MMGGIRQKANKKATRGKGKLWKKGQSSSSNPEFKRHREAARMRARFGEQAAGSSNLTVAQLEQHNRRTIESQLENSDDDMSIGDGTAITGFTNCSLPTFNKLLRRYDGNSYLHVRMRAALEAIAEVIKSRGEEETEIKYFSTLIVMLDDYESEETLTAVVCLLGIVVKRLNKFSLISLQTKGILEMLTKLLLKYEDSDNCALLRNLLSIIYIFLKAKTRWPEKCEELDVILGFTTHQKPKVRRMAHFVVRSLLINFIPETATTHPQAACVADFCVKKLETQSSESKEVFYILNLLREIIGSFPSLKIKKSCEAIIKVMTLSNSLVTSSCLKALRGLFSIKSPDILTSELNAKLISALYPYQPNLKETQCLLDWLQLMEAAFTNLFKLDEKLCISHLPNFFANTVKCWLSDREAIMQAVAITLNNLLHVCIDATSEVFQGFLFEDPVNNPMHKMFHHVEGTLSYQYHRAWKYIIFVLTGFFETMGKHCHTAMMKCLQSLADLHDSFKFPHISEVERALGVAIEHMGPRIVLLAIPLQIGEEKSDFPRSWLLPLLRDHIKKTELNFFCKYFLALAKKMKDRALVLKQEERVVESKLFELIYSQIWSLLPGFCTEPSDLEKVFKEEGTKGKGFPRILADVLKLEPKLRLTILSAIRLLITKNMENETHIETMAKFANNYLPVLFNLYSPDSKDQVEKEVRLATYETIKIYLQITKKEVHESLFAKAIEKLTSSSSDVFKQTSLIDIAKAFLPYINEELIGLLYEFSKPLLMHSDHTLQKKAFGVLKEICSGDSESCKSFVKTNREDLRVVLSTTVSTMPPSTKALRLNCLQCMVSQLTVNEMSCIEDIIPEATLSTKENSVKARTAAFNLLVEIGHSFKRLMPENNQGALRKYVALLLAGLKGRPHMMSATILAIGRVLYEFKADLDSDLVHLLIENICLLLTSQAREVVVSALSFLKIIFATVDTLALAQHVETLVKSITNLSEDNQRHFRFKAKEIFTRLIRKFGYEMIAKLVPEKYHKQLTNIRKLEARRQRNKTLKSADSDSEEDMFDKRNNEYDALLADSDDEVDEEEGLVQSAREPKMKRVKESCLEERDENDIVDFMDPSASKRLTSMPGKDVHSVAKPMNAFPVADDGRIIIEDEEEKSKSKKKQDEEMPSFADLLKKKRKHEDSDDEKPGPSTSTQDVKKGIHRTLQPKPKRKCPGEQFKAKRAGGDVKKGKLEPYAYLPFNRQALNKRKQVKLKGQFKTIVRAAKKGATTGLKRKARYAKKKKNPA